MPWRQCCRTLPTGRWAPQPPPAPPPCALRLDWHLLTDRTPALQTWAASLSREDIAASADRQAKAVLLLSYHMKCPTETEVTKRSLASWLACCALCDGLISRVTLQHDENSELGGLESQGGD